MKDLIRQWLCVHKNTIWVCDRKLTIENPELKKPKLLEITKTFMCEDCGKFIKHHFKFK